MTDVDVRAEARTYLRDNDNGNSNSNSNGNDKDKDKRWGIGVTLRWGEKGHTSGLKPLFLCGYVRPEPEGSGYLS
ncbi:MAG TPA: hypothetical protein VIJ65_04575 [Acidobacteriaceae bacterium]